MLVELERLRHENQRLRLQLKRELAEEQKRIEETTGFRPRLAGYKYPIPYMRVGESFFVPDKSRQRCLRAMASYWGQKLGKRFSVRSWTHQGVKGIKVVRWE